MSFVLHGLAVSPGIAIGHVSLVSQATLEVSQYHVAERGVEAEIARFDAALSTVRVELGVLRREAGAAPGAPAELSAFVDLHAMILTDPLLTEVPKQLIRERRCNAEWALVQQLGQITAQFDEIEDAYLRERKHDIVQVVERVVKVLLGHQRRVVKHSHDEDLIIVAHDLSPADTIQFKQLKISGFVTDLGGPTSHTAIVARSLAIPAVVGLQHARGLVEDGELVIVDGSRGVIIVAPDERVLEEYRLRRSQLDLERSKLRRLKSSRSVTLDGQEVELGVNIEMPQDIDRVKEVNAAGIGLFRTEFLFMNRDDLPGEDEQFEAYRSVVKAMPGKAVTIRSLDLGADKTARALRNGGRVEANPALGRRAIRFCLAEPQIFLAQLRAILRASHYGRVRLLVPMLAHAHEIEQTLVMLELAKASLREARVKFDERIEVGGMIEIPAAALALGPFLDKLDFLSIGTNDLTQYTLAIDRSDDAVSYLYDPLHPAVLRLVEMTIAAGRRAGVPVAVCGEMAGDPALTRLLLGMGLRQFSMNPAQLFEIKQRVMQSDCALLRGRVQRLLRLDDPVRIAEQLLRINVV